MGNIPESGEDAFDCSVNQQAMINYNLLKAARDCDLQAIDTALSMGAFLETRRPFLMLPEAPDTKMNAPPLRGKGLTALMYVAQAGNHAAVEKLVCAGAAVNAEDE